MFLSYPVKRMVEMGKEILQKNSVTDLSDVRWVRFSVYYFGGGVDLFLRPQYRFGVLSVNSIAEKK